jgi:hypothetical protein
MAGRPATCNTPVARNAIGVAHKAISGVGRLDIERRGSGPDSDFAGLGLLRNGDSPRTQVGLGRVDDPEALGQATLIEAATHRHLLAPLA